MRNVKSSLRGSELAQFRMAERYLNASSVRRTLEFQQKARSTSEHLVGILKAKQKTKRNTSQRQQ